MAIPHLIIGNKNYSSWSLRAWLFLRQNQIEFEETRVALFTPEAQAVLSHYDSDFKVPVLEHDGLLVWDSLAIVEYVSDTWLNGSGWPSDPAARAFARSISAEMHSSFFNVRNEFPMNCRKRFVNVTPTADAHREIARIDKLWSKSRDHYGDSGPWLFGQFSIADAMFAPVALRFHGYHIALSETAQAYVETVLGNDCVQEWIAAGLIEPEVIDDDEIDSD